MIPRRYHYMGEQEILLRAGSPPRFHIAAAADVRRWIAETAQQLSRDGEITATFIIDEDGQLWIADRHSEHVACARGEAVLAAGEITFALNNTGLAVSAITNQSTGYCPEPSTWPIIDHALTQAALPHPDSFTSAYDFRRCDACGTTTIIKDNLFECAVCGSTLSKRWNFDEC